MHIHEKRLFIPNVSGPKEIFDHLERSVKFQLSSNEVPLRFVVNGSNADQMACELGVVESESEAFDAIPSLFEFCPREIENTDQFNVALVIPTGIGCEVGGHAGDATPVARLIGEMADTVITHPNVVNGSDLNEMPQNALYVEGSILSRMLMGTIGLQKVRSNRVLVVMDEHKDNYFINATINAVNAARASFGLNCPEVVTVNPPVSMKARFSEFSGRAAGSIESLDFILEVLQEKRETYDAVAVASVINVPEEYHQGYFDAKGEMINPWGGVEAMLTHAISSVLNVPSAHSPMLESQEIANMDPGIVDPRMSAEAISLAFLQSVLKGLHRSPGIVTDQRSIGANGVFSARDISCLVIPDGCVGLPTLAALEQGMPVVAVKENSNIMKNDLRALPWRSNQLHIVENYWEAIGVLTALKGGIAPDSVRRPVRYVQVENNRQPHLEVGTGSD